MTCGMPQQLIVEILNAIKATADVSGKVVVDLCAGFQSLRQAVLAAGAKYVAVDIQGQRPRVSPEDNNRGVAIVLKTSTHVLAQKTRGGNNGNDIIWELPKGRSSGPNYPTHTDGVKALERATGLSEGEWRVHVRSGPETRALKESTYYIYDINQMIPQVTEKRVTWADQATKLNRVCEWVHIVEDGEPTRIWRSEDAQVLRAIESGEQRGGC